MGMDTLERSVDRSELYTADECFLTGTAAHITPVLKVDHRPVGTGRIGQVTAELQKLFFPIITGKNPVYAHWYTLLTPDR